MGVVDQLAVGTVLGQISRRIAGHRLAADLGQAVVLIAAIGPTERICSIKLPRLTYIDAALGERVASNGAQFLKSCIALPIPYRPLMVDKQSVVHPTLTKTPGEYPGYLAYSSA